MRRPLDRILVITQDSSMAIHCHAVLRRADLRDTPYTILPSFDPTAVQTRENYLVLLDADSLPAVIDDVSAGKRRPNCIFAILSNRVTPMLVGAALAAGVRGVLSTSLSIEDASIALDQIVSGVCAYRFDVAAQRDGAATGNEVFSCTPLTASAETRWPAAR